MTEINYSEFITPYEEVEESHGLVNTPLKAGKYHLKVAKVQGKDTTKSGVPRARLQVRAIGEDGEPFGSPAFIDFYLGAGRDKYENGSKVGLKSDDEYRAAVKGALGRVKGFMKSIKVGTGFAGEGLDGVFSFYNVDQWEGGEFVGQITVREDRNDLRNFYPLDDPKNGLASLRKVAPTAAVGTL